MTTRAEQSVLLIGATGFLGGHLARASVDQGLALHILVRPATWHSTQAETRAQLEQLAALGARFHLGDLDDTSSLHRACDGVDYVVSAVDGIERQLTLIDVLTEAEGLCRFLPSEFGVDIWIPEPGTCSLLDQKRAVQQALVRSGVPHSLLYSNCFMTPWAASLGQLTPEPPTDDVVVLGNGHGRATLVAEQDIARAAITTLGDPRTLNRHITLLPPANRLSQLELIELWESKTGTSLQRSYLSASALARTIETMPKPLPAEREMELWRWQLLQVAWIDEATVRRREGVLDGAELYPQIDWRSVSDVLDEIVLREA